MFNKTKRGFFKFRGLRALDFRIHISCYVGTYVSNLCCLSHKPFTESRCPPDEHSCTSTTDENVVVVRKIVMANRRISSWECRHTDWLLLCNLFSCFGHETCGTEALIINASLFFVQNQHRNYASASVPTVLGPL